MVINGKRALERDVDVRSPLHSLPPRPPARPVVRSSSSRPPPPPYRHKNSPANSSKPSPPAYQGRVTNSGNAKRSFTPDESLTPVRITPDAEVVAEGEKRSTIRGKEERNEKAMSVYENVDQSETFNASYGPENSSTVWFEYGCV
ncbi:unnamed protein product [Gongylonema pulchrum]|uniref:Uncharacterized protein n=1 Tax=Gongylonema pulchrum TaxID=637853 RepID=A0A183DB67_9BILA|nr:unnamed protein product [Gongylonema pulchrum]